MNVFARSTTLFALAAFAFAAIGVRAATPVERAVTTAEKGVEFLKSQQQPDGGFQPFPGPPGITAIVLKAIVQDPRYSTKDEFVKKGYDKLLAFQWDTGGIYKDLLANYNTAIAISSLASAEDPSFKPAIDKAVNYLKTLQWTDRISGLAPGGETVADDKDNRYGGFGYGHSARPDGSNTQLALDALRDAGVAPEDPAFQAALKFITRQQNHSETNDQPWSGNDGGFVYTPAGGTAAAPGESQAGEYVGPDGGRMLRSYGSMTYAGLKSMIYAGLSKDDARVKAAWDWLTKNWTVDGNPGMKDDRGDWGRYYYYMTLSRALRAHGEPVVIDPQGKRHDWRIELIDKLASLQKENGSWVGDKKWMEDNAALATSYAVLALEEAIADLKAHAPAP